MTTLAREVGLVQNPAFGALLLWRFCIGYAAGATGRGPAVQALFVVLPVLLHEETARFAIGTRTASGLRAFREKFTAAKREDLLYAVHDRARTLRPLTATALQAAVHARLLVIDLSAEVLPVSQSMPQQKWSEEVRKLASAAEKLGKWMSKVSLFEAASILGVRF
jgi:hypothetical protein